MLWHATTLACATGAGRRSTAPRHGVSRTMDRTAAHRRAARCSQAGSHGRGGAGLRTTGHTPHSRGARGDGAVACTEDGAARRGRLCAARLRPVRRGRHGGPRVPALLRDVYGCSELRVSELRSPRVAYPVYSRRVDSHSAVPLPIFGSAPALCAFCCTGSVCLSYWWHCYHIFLTLGGTISP